MNRRRRAAGGVTVWVFNTEGRPVPRARLTLVDRGGQLLGQGEARADGSCNLSVPEADPYVLLVGATGHLPGVTNIEVAARLLPTETVLLLREVATVRGKVTEDTLYMPVPEALALFMDESGLVTGSAVTSGDGCFEIAGLRPGGYTLMVIHHEYEHWLRRVIVGGNEPLLADATLTRRLLSCRGVVRDARGRPATETVVSLTDGSGLELRVRTDQSGKFDFPTVPQGLYVLGAADRSDLMRVLVDKDLSDMDVTLPDV
ncbi:carboxypeptidase regulatory-like domain-containing protein [Parafrankia sp. BMG5.11]|uniref:carboxypeptidase regulatory-like domain-containing protein n=1 Tax=Parafrankia sp. BMG5.11 TaxID=222540 RepID=UPI00103E2C5C|nr:carboxypeptidase regulatory-like domain-containing protein [Parafrankia sp. BMG5.11]TCJ31793.1 hypothetical protein E0504_46525 [Parafrankia sp. BMG5.11]